MPGIRTISVLGSTGSIGTQVLDVAGRLPDRVRVYALAAGSNIGLLASQISRFHPEVVVTGDANGARKLSRLPESRGVRVLVGSEGMCEVAAAGEVDTVVVGVQGFAGLLPTLAGAERGKVIAIASKEVLVAAKDIVREAVQSGGSRLVPIDSEHSAIFQCLVGEAEEDIEALILTASGGPFAKASPKQMADITPEMALDHPTWKMGRKVTVDSATLMNKGLEVLEAEALFGVGPGQVEVVIHPRSIVHSLVRFRDGSVKAQLGLPDMRLPIQYALLFPQRPDTGLPKLDLVTCGPLEFRAPDEERFPCLRLAREAAAEGGVIPAVMSAADDIAVEAFLDRRVSFLQIADVVEQVMQSAEKMPADNLDVILAADAWARESARRAVAERSHAVSRGVD